MRNSSGTWATLAFLSLLLSGCVGLPRHVQKYRSEALPNPQTTSLGHLIAAEQGNENLSGIRLLTSGEEALADLIALADRAERTLDIQYYIIHQDESAALLLHHVRLAADRGVRVRVLVDDLNTVGEDRRFLHLSEHANVEVRVFNPFPGARFSTWTRFVASATDIRRINHRMHNKLFVADNALAITGGRNIGDQYFTRDQYNNFIDLDVVAAGAIVPQLSASFDAFWNSKYAYPIASVASPAGAEPASPPPAADAFARSPDWLEGELESGKVKVDLTWVPATVLADRPAKIASETSSDEEVTIANDLAALMRSARQELIVISPYFVPGDDGVALFAKLVSEGVHIRILTNSLASTDSPVVHHGYAHYRVALLKLGIELSEVRPKLGQKRARFHPFRQFHRQPSRQGRGDRSKDRIHRIDEHGRAFGPHQQRTGTRDAQRRHRTPGHQPARRHQRGGELHAAIGGSQQSNRVVQRRAGFGKALVHRPGNHPIAALRAENARAVRAGGAAVTGDGRRRPPQEIRSVLKYSFTLARYPSLLVTVAPPASTRMKSPRRVRFTSLR